MMGNLISEKMLPPEVQSSKPSRTAQQEPDDRRDDVPRSVRLWGVYALASRRMSGRRSASGT